MHARALPALVLCLCMSTPLAAQITKAPAQKTKQAIKVETFAKGLVHPWGMAFLPDGRLLVTERPGRLRIVGKDGKLSAPAAGVPKVYASGQGGLLDVQVGPDFASSGAVYLSYADPRDGSRNGTSVARGRLVTDGDGGRLEDVKVIFRQEPSYASGNHFGSRIVFARDGSLFVTLGDRYSARDEAQNPANHLGKLVRIMADGSPYAGNPKKPGWRPEIWSIGHRNVQGAALNPADRQAVDRRARRARRRRDQHPRGRQELRLAGHHLRPRLLLPEDRRGHGQARPGAADLLLGPVDRALRRGVLHRRSASRNGRATCSSARWPARRCTGSCSTATRSWARRSCSPISASASATCATAPTAPSGC